MRIAHRVNAAAERFEMAAKEVRAFANQSVCAGRVIGRQGRQTDHSVGPRRESSKMPRQFVHIKIIFAWFSQDKCIENRCDLFPGKDIGESWNALWEHALFAGEHQLLKWNAAKD